MPRLPKLTDDFWTEVEAYYLQGNGYANCSKKFGVNWQTVRNHLKKRGNVKPHPSRAGQHWIQTVIKEVEVIREVVVEVPQIVVEVEQAKTLKEVEVAQQSAAPPPPKRRIVGSNNSKVYER